MKRMNAKNYRRIEAEKRQEARSNRSPKEQLAVLDKRLGKGVGAVKEREQLTHALSEAKRLKEQEAKKKAEKKEKQSK